MPACNPDKYTMVCIAGAAWNAGFKDRPTLERATAVAYAESSGRARVVNSIGCCVGLWQINVKAHTQYTTAQMQDPQANANAAWAISNGGRNWKPWQAFTTGAYLLYMPAAKTAVTTLQKQGTPIPDKPGGLNPFDPKTDSPLPDQLENPLDSTASSISNLAQFPAKVTAWISDRNNIIRLVKVMTGVVIAVVGIGIVARPVINQTVNTATKVAGTVK
jgi:hypothetical protein